MAIEGKPEGTVDKTKKKFEGFLSSVYVPNRHQPTSLHRGSDMPMDYWAHLKPSGEGHSLVDHLLATADLAARFAKSIRGEELARLLGLWHDLGKFRPAFQKRLQISTQFPSAVAPRALHAPVGALLAWRCNPWLATLIYGHHGGLKHRQQVKNLLHNDENQWPGFRAEVNELLGGLFSKHPDLLIKKPPLRVQPLIPPGLSRDEEKRAIELWLRLLFSCLVDADYLDTEAFYDSKASVARGRFQSISELEAELTAHVEQLRASAPDSPVNRVRNDVLRTCLKRAADAPGLFSLTVPTGGGKTLTSLAFALRHALVHNLDRVIVVVPYTSIIDQTAATYRNIFGDEQVIEHHSLSEKDGDDTQTHLMSKLAAENWDAPIVVTTSVQFFESLFASRPGKCRKLHNITRSVVILDEVQTLPDGMLGPILDVLRRLSDSYGTSIVFCTATQPAFSHMDDPALWLENVRELVPCPAALFPKLSRVRVHWPKDSCLRVTWTELAERLIGHERVLVIVHRRADAVELTQAVDEALGDESTIHLSASMCPVHRMAVIDTIKERLQNNTPIRVVSTQLVEAGVDLDFPVVYRALAGLDSLAQSAGRCNREGRLEFGDFHIFISPTSPPKGVLERALGQTRGMLNSGGGALDLQNPELFQCFFNRLYCTGVADAKGIQPLREQFDFPRVAETFKMIDDNHSESVIVPFGNAQALIDDFLKADPRRRKALLRRLRRYTVAIPKNFFNRWRDCGVLEPVCDVFWHIPPGRMSLYKDRFGVVLEASPPYQEGALTV